MKDLFSPYSLSQTFKFLGFCGILIINYCIRDWLVASVSVFVIGTFIASEAFILMLARSIFKNPTDENIVKLFIILLFKNKDQADKIINDYKKIEQETIRNTGE